MLVPDFLSLLGANQGIEVENDRWNGGRQLLIGFGRPGRLKQVDLWITLLLMHVLWATAFASVLLIECRSGSITQTTISQTRRVLSRAFFLLEEISMLWGVECLFSCVLRRVQGQEAKGYLSFSPPRPSMSL